ncbi:MAG: MotA/TolQ/ExbB proton channel family protein [Cyanobacteriota bacterium]|nr:MotA/TolQ/ExbB proton channel family protein [Cyanobacteriota bacterium]
MIANFPPLANLPAEGAAASAPSDLRSNNDLDPRLNRWAVIGAVAGFLIWAITTPSAAPFHAFLHQRGPTQVICLVAAGMVSAFLVSKWQLLQRQARKLEPLGQNITSALQAGNIDGASQQAEQSASLLGKRLLRLLAVWRASQSSFQLERTADADSDYYQLAMQNSYSLIKVLLWAIPILGFIGTVIGMSQAVGSFESVLGNADNVDGLKAGLTKVTSGLGTAFDTTYLALVISVLLAIPINAIERREEQLLNAIDGRVRDAVLALSPMGESAGGSLHPAADPVMAPLNLQSRELGALINEAFEQHLPDPSVLVAPAQHYAEQLTEAALAKLDPLTTLVRDSVEGVAEARLSLQEQAQIIRGSMDGAAQDLNASLQQLRPLLRELQSASTLGTVLGEELSSFKASVELRRAIEQLSGQLGQLEQLQREQLQHSRRQLRWPWR